MNADAYAGEARSALDSMFSPKSVAVIGATDREGSVGRIVLERLRIPSFRGRIYPVNPNHTDVLGLRAYPKIGDIPEKIDLAVIVTPARTVPGVVGECVDAGVRAAVVISAGFKERGPEGAALELEIQKQLRRGAMRLLGPNCLGVMNPHAGFNATFAQDIARPGNVAFLSQSGALLTAILDWSLQEQVGFSAIVSTGSMLDVGWGDLIDYFGDDPSTGSILLYMESVGDARSFLSAAREVALRKPIIVIKAGRTPAASKAASSHTGALTGSDEVFDAALRRCGVLRVSSVSDLFYMAEVLSKQPRPRGPKLMILTNAGGPGVIATDRLLSVGGELAPLSDSTMESLNALLPAHWSHGNPIDILGDAGPERYSKALEIAAKDPNSDGLLVILAPQGMTDPAHVAESLKAHASVHGKPVLASWMGGKSVAEGIAILNAANIPTFSYPDTAARAFTYMWKYTYNLRGLYETPVLSDAADSFGQAQSQAKSFLEKIRAAGRTILTEAESKHVIALYGIPTVETRLASNESQAAECAEAIGFPVALKLNSETITHKSDVGGVKLNLQSREDVAQAYREIEMSVREKAGAARFSRRYRATHGEARRIRTHSGQQRGRAIRPRHPFWFRRPNGGGVWRPRAGAAAAEFHAGRALDGANENLSRAARRAGPRGRGHGRARKYTDPLQQDGGRATMDQGSGYQSVGRYARARDGSRCANRLAGPGRGGGPPSAFGHPAVPGAVRFTVAGEKRDASVDSADPSRGRTRDGQVSRDAFGSQRVLAIFSPG